MKYKISWWRTGFGNDEVRRITEAINHEYVSQGPVTAEFEQAIAKTLDVPYVVATTSGSMAMLMALIAAGVGQGDEVIVPNRTWIATAHAPLLLGAKPVLVDVEADFPIMDVSQLKKKITSRTKVIMPVHLNGRSVNMPEVNRIANERGLRVIEDAAQAFCSRNKNGFLGTQSFAGCFSLSVAKLISTGQGGFVAAKDKKTYEKLRLIRTHGIRDVIRVNYEGFGFNFRFNDILASIGLAQLNRLKARISYAKRIYRLYEQLLTRVPYLKLIPVNIEAGEIPIYIEVLSAKRDKLVEFLAGNGIQSRPFYPDLNQAGHLGCGGIFKHSEVFGKQGLFLPCGPAQSISNIERTVEVLRKFR